MARKTQNNYIITNCLFIDKSVEAIIKHDLVDTIPQRYNFIFDANSKKTSVEGGVPTYEKNSVGFDKYFDKISLK